MQYVNGNILTLEYRELVPDVITQYAYDDAKKDGRITVHGYGGNGRTVLIEFETMPNAYKQKVRAKYGDPYEYAAKQPLLNAIETDYLASDFYEGYVLPNGEKLPSSDTDLKGNEQINYVKRYTQNAEWLNMIGRLTADKITLRLELNITMAAFWEAVTSLIKTHNVALPGTAKRLKGTLAKYQEGGYESIIEKHKWGNSNSAKVSDEVSKSYLLALIGLGHNDAIVASNYNVWAMKNGYKTIVPGTVAYQRGLHKPELLLEREGVDAVQNLYSKKIARLRPTAPLLLINADDNDWDVYFFNDPQTHYRVVLYVVRDVFNDYVLGWAMGAAQTNDLMYEAFYNAHRHVMELTNGAYCWQQLQTDRWGIEVRGKKTELSKRLGEIGGKFTPAARDSKTAKYIERTFAADWHNHLKILYPHCYAGHNVKAKKRNLNPDNLNPKNFPDISNAYKMADLFIETLRHSKRTKDSEFTRQEEWVAAFNASEKAKKRILTTANRLDLFGTAYGQLKTVSSNMLKLTIQGESRIYEFSQEFMLKYVGTKIQIKYDPADLSEVLITNGKGLREVVSDFGLISSNISDEKDMGDQERKLQLQDEKKTLLPLLQQKLDARNIILQREGIDAASNLQANLLDKTKLREDQRLFVEKAFGINRVNGAKTIELEGGVCAENDELNEGVSTTETIKKQPVRAKKQENSYYEEW